VAKKVVHTLIGVRPESEVIYLDDNLNIIYHVEQVGLDGIVEFNYTWNPGGDRFVRIYIHHLHYKWQQLTDVYLGKKDGQIQIFQVPDNVYKNPD
jgi:hypothetical protein